MLKAVRLEGSVVDKITTQPIHQRRCQRHSLDSFQMNSGASSPRVRKSLAVKVVDCSSVENFSKQ